MTYTVRRESFNNNRNWSGNYTKPEIIVTDTTKTDASGKFTIVFVAKPDDTTKKADLPIFSYWIKADVTDINGETHTIDKLIAK